MQEQAKEIETLKNQVTSLAELNDFFGKVKATGENSATYYACMDIRCKAAAKIPIKVLQQGEHGTILRADHAVYRMLHDRPNQLCTAYDFKFATEFQRLEYGNAYWLPVYNLAGRLAQIQLLDSQKVTIQINSALEPWQPGYLLYYYSGPSGMRILTPDEILHFKNYSKDGIHGRSVRQQIMDVIQAEESGQSLLKSKYESGLIDPLIVEADVDLSDKKRKQAVIKKFSGFRGVEHAGEVIPIPPDFKVQQLSTKLVDSQFFEMQGLTTKRIANGFGVPGFMLNDLDGGHLLQHPAAERPLLFRHHAVHLHPVRGGDGRQAVHYIRAPSGDFCPVQRGRHASQRHQEPVRRLFCGHFRRIYENQRGAGKRKPSLCGGYRPAADWQRRICPPGPAGGTVHQWNTEGR